MRPSIIEFKQVSKHFRSEWTFRKRIAVKSLTMSIQQGEIFGFIGQNGAGKTTSIQMLLGIICPSAGTVLMHGQNPFKYKNRQSLGFLPERPYFPDQLTAYDILSLHGGLANVSYRSLKSEISRMLEWVDLQTTQKKKLREFSKGMLQKLGLACALIGDPDIIILDEPMSGLDPVARKQVREIIVSLKQRGKTIFFSSHALNDIELMCDRVAMLHQGELKMLGTVNELLGKNESQESEVTLLVPKQNVTNEHKIFMNSTLTSERYLHGICRNDVLESSLNKAFLAGFKLVSVTPKHNSLEQEYVKHIQEHAKETRL